MSLKYSINQVDIYVSFISTVDGFVGIIRLVVYVSALSYIELKYTVKSELYTRV